MAEPEPATPQATTPEPASPESSSPRRWQPLRWIVRIRRRLSLSVGTAVDATSTRITDAIHLRGEAPWILVCASLLASIGLDVNSTAVIIGAMLISPLMSPILGIGLAIGVADRRLLLVAARELGLATLISLCISAIYFRLSPLGEPTPELIARTTPTLLDVAVAFFGGVAGIIAGSRKQTSLALPGVAIATALMPPLCTAGFGLATGRWSFFFGALYLFALNALFIALATFLVVRTLEFPLRSFSSARARTREVRIIGAVATIAILPSLWFLYTTVLKQRERRRVEQFVAETIERRGHDVLRWDRQESGDSSVLKVFVAGAPLSDAELDSVNASRGDFGLNTMRVQAIQSDVSGEDLVRVRADLQNSFLQLLAGQQAARDSVNRESRRRDSLGRARGVLLDSAAMRKLVADVRVVFPELREVAWVPIANLLDSAARPALPPTLQLRFQPNVPTARRRDLGQRIELLVRTRVGTDSIRVEVR